MGFQFHMPPGCHTYVDLPLSIPIPPSVRVLYWDNFIYNFNTYIYMFLIYLCNAFTIRRPASGKLRYVVLTEALEHEFVLCFLNCVIQLVTSRGRSSKASVRFL